MMAALAPVETWQPIDCLEPETEAGYQRWRAEKLARRPRDVGDLIVDVGNPKMLAATERDALLQRCSDWNMAIYRSASGATDKDVTMMLGRQLGLRRLDSNWLADDDGISSIQVSDSSDDRGGFIPYTDRPIRWHTDGYYHPPERSIRAMLLHCVQPAHSGGVTTLLDPELVYIAVRDASHRWLQALMAPDAMSIPGREGAQGVAREAQTGPVFSFDANDGSLHMRYTARTRSIKWKSDPATAAAVVFLDRFLAATNPDVMQVRLEAGMGVVSNNVLHERSAFVDNAAQPRLLFRGRFLDRIGDLGATWRNG